MMIFNAIYYLKLYNPQYISEAKTCLLYSSQLAQHISKYLATPVTPSRKNFLSKTNITSIRSNCMGV